MTAVTTVRALAHPLRSRLMITLRVGGPATATALAAALGTNSGATSYHLRALEAAGLVHDTGLGDRRSRVWAASEEQPLPRPGDLGEDADAETAFGWLSRDWLDHFAGKFARWLELRPSWPAAWRDAAAMHDDMVVVTADQLDALHGELAEVVSRYRRVGAGNPDAKRVATYLASYPVDMEQVPRHGRESGGR